MRAGGGSWQYPRSHGAACDYLRVDALQTKVRGNYFQM